MPSLEGNQQTHPVPIHEIPFLDGVVVFPSAIFPPTRVLWHRSRQGLLSELHTAAPIDLGLIARGSPREQNQREASQRNASCSDDPVSSRGRSLLRIHLCRTTTHQLNPTQRFANRAQARVESGPAPGSQELTTGSLARARDGGGSPWSIQTSPNRERYRLRHPPEQMEEVVAECPFDEVFPGPEWTVIRGEAGGWSASGGVLSLPTLPGGIWNSEMAQAKNMFVRDIPGWDQKAAPLAAEARVRMMPESWGEQAGIWLYAADDHWVKLVVERKKDGSTKVCFASRSPDKPAASVANQELPSSASKPGEEGGVSLRIEVSKDRSEVAGLVNCGYCIRLVGKLGISLPSGTRVGVMAHGGDAEDPPRMAAFDQMRLIAIAPDRVQFAGKQEETPVAAQAAAAAAAAGAAAGDGGEGLVQTPSGWTLSSSMSAEKMAQVMSLIGETGAAGGGEGSGAAPYVVLGPGGGGEPSPP